MQRRKNQVINQALEEDIEREGREQKRWQETLCAMASVAEGNLIPGEYVRRWLDSWGAKDELPPPEAKR